MNFDDNCVMTLGRVTLSDSRVFCFRESYENTRECENGNALVCLVMVCILFAFGIPLHAA